MGSVLFLLQCYSALAAVADPSLDQVAIPIENPQGVPLISITRAGDRLVAVGAHGVIIFSDDNAKSWNQAKVPVSVGLTAIAFATPKQGWAAGDEGVILHTDDGGETWKLQLTGNQVDQLMTTEAREYSVANAGSDQAARAIRRANIFLGAGADKPFLDILTISSMKSIVFGAYRMAVMTEDGGKTWRDISLQVGDPISHNIYGLAQFGSNIYLALETGLILRSTDGGATFSQIAQPGEVTLFGIVAAANGNLLAYGVAGSLFRSVDSGSTWMSVDLNTNFNLTSARMLPTGAIVIADESGEVFMSTDDGLTFQKMPKSIGMQIYDFQPTANGAIAFVGDLGVRVANIP
jgi:photosystem II stability/assembly factor-like uncharacterized protein